MKLALDSNGSNAEAMLSRILPMPIAIDFVQSIGGGSIATCDANVHRGSNGSFLVTLGTPLSPADPERISDTRAAIELLPTQDGAFVSIYWNDRERILVIVTDFLGFEPLYLRRSHGGLQLANATRAWNGAPDLAAWGAFISFGHTIGDRTLLAGVERVRPATILVYQPDTDQLSEQQYWTWPKPSNDVDVDVNELADAFLDSIERYAAYGIPGTVLLSGGFDSRLLACALVQVGIHPNALSVAHSDEFFDADGRIAKKVASTLALPFERVHSAPDFFSKREFLDYLFESDAATPSLFLFIAQVFQFIRAPAVWEGLIPGNTLKTSNQPPGTFDQYLATQCQALSATIWNNARTIFDADTVSEMAARFTEDLQENVLRFPDTAHGVTEFIIRNRARNRTGINPLKVYSARVRAFIPGMTRRFFDLAGTLSYEARANYRLYRTLFERRFPKAAYHPIVSGSKLVRFSSWSPNYHANRLLGAVARVLDDYPSISRPLGWQRGALPLHSRYLDPNLLLDDDDPYLTVSQVREYWKKDELPIGARKLCFHWRAWRLLHEGQLYRLDS